MDVDSGWNELSHAKEKIGTEEIQKLVHGHPISQKLDADSAILVTSGADGRGSMMSTLH